MGVLLDLVVPGSGTVVQTLATILQLCGEMKEAQDICKRTRQRLNVVYDDLTKMEKKKRLPASDALDMFVAVVAKTLRFLERYRGKKLVFRLMAHEAMVEELRVVNEDIDVLVCQLNLSTVMDWKQRWEDDLRTQNELLASSVTNAQSVLADLYDARSQQETLLTLKYEVERQPEQKNPEMRKLMKAMMGTVIRASTATVPALPPWFLPPCEIHFDPEPFARGSFATAHRGVWGAGTNVVVKCFHVDGDGGDSKTRQNIEAEMNLWHQFDHPNVVKLLGASHISTPPFIVCEDATNGDLHSFLARSDTSKRQMWRLLYEAALGLHYIHKKSVVHGDLKLNNILVGADGKAKVSDFGLSIVQTPATIYETPGEAIFTAGALRWRAPECLKKAPTFASDVYSFAMCMIEAVDGDPPFAFLDDGSVHEKLRNGQIPEKPEEMPIEAWDLVMAMTNADPEKRVGLAHVLTSLKALAGCEAKKSQQQSTKQSGTANTSAETCGADIIAELLDILPVLNDSEKEQALQLLVQTAVKDEDRLVMYKANGLRTLTNLVKSGRTFYTKLYALQCLKWSALLDSKLPKSDFDTLRDSFPAASVNELTAVMHAVKGATDQEREEAVICCACIATRGIGSIQRDAKIPQPLARRKPEDEAPKLWVGMVQLIASLLQSDNGTDKLWAAEAMGSLVMENEEILAEIMRIDAITPLVALLWAGTIEQKHKTAYALKNLDLQRKEVSQLIVKQGAIEPLVVLSQLGTAQQKQTTTALLENLLLPSYANVDDVERERAVTPLIGLVLVGTDEQKETAVAELAILAKDDEIRTEIASKGGIAPLITLLENGTNSLKGYAVSVLVNLASNDTVSVKISREGGIAPLVELLRSGDDTHKAYVACALVNLSFNDAIAAEIVHNGGVAPLIELVRSGTEQQKDYTVRALLNLTAHDEFRTEIAREGGVKPLVELFRTGTDQQKGSTGGTILNLFLNGAIRATIVRERGVSVFLELLRSGTDQQTERAADILKNLADSEEGRSAIAREGGIATLAALLRNGSKRQKEYAASIIEKLARSNGKVRVELARQGNVMLLKSLGRSGNEKQNESTTQTLQPLNGGCCVLM